MVDLDAMENNLRRCQTYLDRHGLSLRPHIKTHKIPEFAHLQVKLGAKGVNCQKLGEAEVMVDAGIADILLTYNLIGQTKLDRLVGLVSKRLAKRQAALSASAHALEDPFGEPDEAHAMMNATGATVASKSSCATVLLSLKLPL